MGVRYQKHDDTALIIEIENVELVNAEVEKVGVREGAEFFDSDTTLTMPYVTGQ